MSITSTSKTVCSVLAACVLLSGCVSLAETFHEDDQSKVYIGTRTDAKLVAASLRSRFSEFLFHLIDLPLSFVMDTVLLPYTVFFTPPDQTEPVPDPEPE
jgi:uncharacterized protein YceK